MASTQKHISKYNPFEKDDIKNFHKQALLGSILSYLSYCHSGSIFDDKILSILGLTLKYTSSLYDKQVKFVVFTKASEKEKQKLDENFEINSFLDNIQPDEIEDPFDWYETKRDIKSRMEYAKKLKKKLVPGRIFTDSFIEEIRKHNLSELIQEDDIFIAFRGTQFHDFDTIKKDLQKSIFVFNRDNYDNSSPKYKNIFNVLNVFSGYDKAFEDISENLVHILDVYREKKNRVFVGHSMGGALAILGAYYTSILDKEPDHKFNIMTFGCPKFINNKHTVSKILKQLKNYYHIGVKHQDDLISNYPRQSLGFYRYPSYYHIKTETETETEKDNSTTIIVPKAVCLDKTDTYSLICLHGKISKYNLSPKQSKTDNSHSIKSYICLLSNKVDNKKIGNETIVPCDISRPIKELKQHWFLWNRASAPTY
jgi:hypothetical protein